jgi:hypothetical protein
MHREQACRDYYQQVCRQLPLPLVLPSIDTYLT